MASQVYINEINKKVVEAIEAVTGEIMLDGTGQIYPENQGLWGTVAVNSEYLAKLIEVAMEEKRKC